MKIVTQRGPWIGLHSQNSFANIDRRSRLKRPRGNVLVSSLVTYQSLGNANTLRKLGEAKRRREERGEEGRGCFVWPHRGKRNAGNAFPTITIIHERLHYPFAARRLLFFIYGQAHYFCASKHMKNSLSPVLPPLVTRILCLFWFLLLCSILVRLSFSFHGSSQAGPRFY